MKKHIVFLTGAGMSQESGIKTFRDTNGLWENHSVEDVASPEGFERNPALVYDFYNKRRAQLKDVSPNKGHELIAQLENEYKVTIVTQNVDDLHERAGSTNVLHLHGELRKVRSMENPKLVYNWEQDLDASSRNEEGHQLRPHIVWFGESVPEIENAMNIVNDADILVIVGTSLQVYPAAGLHLEAKQGTRKIYIDPNPSQVLEATIEVIAKKASIGLEAFIRKHL
jgi:NAD-dependent deacetylase